MESGGKRKRRGGGSCICYRLKKILALNCVLKAQGKTFVILSKVFKLNGIHLSKGLKSIILPVNKMEYTAVKGLILDIIAMCFSDVSQEWCHVFDEACRQPFVSHNSLCSVVPVTCSAAGNWQLQAGQWHGQMEQNQVGAPLNPTFRFMEIAVKCQLSGK